MEKHLKSLEPYILFYHLKIAPDRKALKVAGALYTFSRLQKA